MRHRLLNNQQQQQQPQQSQEQLLLDLTNSETPSPASTNGPFTEEKDIMQKLLQCRLDRERLSVLEEAIKATLPGLENQLLAKVYIIDVSK